MDKKNTPVSSEIIETPAEGGAESVASVGKRPPQVVEEDESGMRVDRWFKRRFPTLSHGQVQKHLRTGQIRVDGKRAEASDHVEGGQAIRVPPSFYDTSVDGEVNTKNIGVLRQSKMKEGDAAKLRQMILFEDDDVIVLNKPSGLAVQGGTGLKENLDDSLMALSKDGKTKPKLVHRLDRDTSGVLLVARTDYAARQLTAAFRERETQKIYWALTLGVPRPEMGRINAPLYRCGEVMKVYEKGVTDEEEEVKSAISLYQVVETALKQAAFVALWPVTGRTHQLRVHMQHLGTPILGDRLYTGDTEANLPMGEMGKGLHLHARRLIVPHPRRGKIDVSAPLSPEMAKTWRWFGFSAKVKTDFDF